MSTKLDLKVTAKTTKGRLAQIAAYYDAKFEPDAIRWLAGKKRKSASTKRTAASAK